MTPPQITYYVVIPPLPGLDSPPLRPISKLVQIEEDMVAKKLRTGTFEVMGRFARAANAEGLVNQLKALGVDSFVVSDQDIRGHLIISVAGANRGGGGMALMDFNAKPLFCPYDDLAGICVLEIYCEGGGQSTLIDLHRKSANITPRMDVSLFDFPKMLGSPGATYEDFLLDLVNRTDLRLDRHFATNYQDVIQATANFGSRPTVFTPPAEKLASPYDKHSHDAASLYSFVRQLIEKR
jgi:hypothetical protein